MADHSARRFKAFMACVYAFPFSYFVAVLIANIHKFDRTNLSQMIRSGLCGNSITQEWASSLCKCRDVTKDVDLLMHYHGVHLFDQKGEAEALFVKTHKTNGETTVSDISSVARATHEIIRSCQTMKDKQINGINQQMGTFALLKDVCSLIELHLRRNIPSETQLSQGHDIWESVKELLRTAETMRGVPLLGLLSNLTTVQDTPIHTQEDDMAMEHLRALLNTLMEYLDDQRIQHKTKRGVTSADILKHPNPLAFVAETALPRLNIADMGLVEDNVIHIFTALPEAASVLAYAVQHKIAFYNYIHKTDIRDRLHLLRIFIANLQVLVTSTLDNTSSFVQIVDNKNIDTLVDVPLGNFWEVFVTDDKSRVYLMNVVKRAINTKINEALYPTMEHNVTMATRITTHWANDDRTYDYTMVGHANMIENATHHMLQLSKFILSDSDHSGYITLYEFVKSVMGEDEEVEAFNEYVKRIMDNQGEVLLSYDFDFINGKAKMLKHQYRMELEAVNPKYNEVLDTFMIIDADGSGEISLEELLDHSYVTSSFSTVHIGEQYHSITTR